MGQRIDLTGQRFGKLIVIRETPKRSRQGDVYWECLCDCGKVDIVNGKSLRSGSQKSCGCLYIMTTQSSILRQKHMEGAEQNDCIEYGEV